jgi:SAM-dependent methyltransferase
MAHKAGIDNDVTRLNREWMGDLAGRKVLDLGCFDGNPLSMYLAENSDSYLGLDLSEQAAGRLNRKLSEAGLYSSNKKAVAGDFLSQDFREADFDVVYAKSVLHHFKHFDAMLRVLHDKLAPNGIVVTQDPMQTALSARVVRTLYRPLQSDKAWEFPFTKRTFDDLQKYFVIEDLQGVLGWAKWTFAAYPLGVNRVAWLCQKLHEKDSENARKPGRALWRCMQVTMKLRRKMLTT